MADDLAAGFQSVDRASEFEVFADCLTLIDSLPFFAECKRESYELLAAGPGARILEVGCGLGDDAAALAHRVSPGGAVVAVDGSGAMVAAARRRHGNVPGLSFGVADATRLPHGEGSFDGCRIDRVLQHIAAPATAVREMARVLRPGGTLVAFDNDWETLTIDSANRPLTRTILNAWCDRFPSGWIGRQMPALFMAAGLTDVRVYPKTFVSNDLGVADRVFSFFTTAEGLVGAGAVDRDDTDRWRDELRAADAAGRFFTSYTGFLVAGTRPGGEPSRVERVYED